METIGPSRVRLGRFALDLRTGELVSPDGKVILQQQPFQVLLMLVDSRGEMVTREEIRKKLWPNDTIVEFDHAINTAIKKLRQALGDSADSPAYIETVARRGYRLLVPPEAMEAPLASGSEDHGPGLVPANGEAGSPLAPAVLGNLTGRKISHYRVLEVLGGGGMGVVYRAEDLKLGRAVALKFLPEELASDPASLERFEREARAASALEHPNICPVYEFGEHDGQPFIAMQLLSGLTLRELIGEEAAAPPAKGAPLPIGRLLDLAVQIAEGLEAAHSKGIIHRDIKPANIFVTTRGEAKILDFGLAKLQALAFREMGPDVESAGGLTPDAAAPHLTRTGVRMGTASYMSPEQIRGEKIDTRTDLFSFGLVLYEMATGRRAFPGSTASVIHDGILNRAPAPIASINPDVAPELDRIVNRLLEKDRDLRYQSAADLRSELKRLKRDMDSALGRGAAVPALDRDVGPGLVPAPSANGAASAIPSVAASVSAGHPRGVPVRRWPLWLAGSLGVFVAGLAAAWLLLHRQPPASPAELTQKRLTFNSTENPVGGAQISPDAKYLAYHDLTGLHIKLLSTGEERLVAKPAGAPPGASWFCDSWFPDSTQLLADTWDRGAQQSIWKFSVIGQSAHELRERAIGYEVSPDGTLVAFSPLAASGDGRELWVMGSQGDKPQRVLGPEQSESFWDVHWSPDGQRLAYIKARLTPGKYDTALETCDLKGENRTVVVRGTDSLRLRWFCWLADGRIIYDARGSDLWQVSVSARTGAPIGEPKRISEWAESSLGELSASADGKRLTFLKSTRQEQLYLGELTAGGTRMNPPRRLTNDDASDEPWAWTADSKAVLLSSNRDGFWNIFKQGITQDTPEPVIPGSQSQRADSPRLSADGAWILYSEFPEGGGLARLMRVPANGGASQFLLEARDFDYSCARAPASLCVIAEESQDKKSFTLTALDLLKGRGNVLRTIEKDPSVHFAPPAGQAERRALGAISPDGTTYALYQGGVAGIHIRLLSLTGGSDREIVVKGWPNIDGLEWAPDGKGLYAGTDSNPSTMLHVDLHGNARVLWQFKGGGQIFWGVPSPDGRYLAILVGGTNSSVWMLEGF